MIISASRRTDIPAFYSRWFMNRIRAGYCVVVNPFNARQVTRISLAPRDVEVIVFWTRHAGPILRHLPELDRLGYRTTFQYTVVGYPRAVDPSVPPLETALRTFRETALRVGPDRITWRYDPVFVSSLTDVPYHRDRFVRIAEALRGLTRRSVVSVMHRYRKVEKRLKRLAAGGIHPLDPAEEAMQRLLADFAEAARRNGMQISSCGSETDLTSLGIDSGRCIDAETLSRIFGIRLPASKACSRNQSGPTESSKSVSSSAFEAATDSFASPADTPVSSDSNTSVVSPISNRSPERNIRALAIFCPLICVPFRLPRSSTHHSPLDKNTRAWRLETIGSRI